MAKKKKFTDETILYIRSQRGLAVRIAEACAIERSSVYQWKQVPLKRVHEVSKVIGKKPAQIRPDFFRGTAKA
jgi:hypothetical protein